jgi:ribose 5-phosphate isomerase B
MNPHRPQNITSTLKSKKMKVAFASDHAGYELKQSLMELMKQRGYEPVDFGTNSTDSCDYPDYAHPAADAVEKGECAFGIAMCGTGNGISMTLNKHQGIRAALCWEPEIAALAKQHNNANILVLPARFVSEEMAVKIVDAYLNAEYEGGRHQRRIDKIPVH